MKLRLGKKGVNLLDLIFLQLLPIAFIIFMTLFLLYKEMEDSNSARLYLARNEPIKLNAEYSLQGNLYDIDQAPIKYEITSEPGLQLVDYSFDDNFVDVSGIKFPYASNSFVNLIPLNTKNTDTLISWKYGSSLFIMTPNQTRMPPYYALKRPNIPVIKTYLPNWQSETISLKSTDKLSEDILTAFKNFYDNKLNIKDKLESDALIYFELIIDNSNNIIAEIPCHKTAKSRKFASILINKLTDKAQESDKGIQDIYIKPIKQDYNAESAVRLTIGKKLVPTRPLFNTLFYETIKDYFEKWQ